MGRPVALLAVAILSVAITISFGTHHNVLLQDSNGLCFESPTTAIIGQHHMIKKAVCDGWNPYQAWEIAVPAFILVNHQTKNCITVDVGDGHFGMRSTDCTNWNITNWNSGSAPPFIQLNNTQSGRCLNGDTSAHEACSSVSGQSIRAINWPDGPICNSEMVHHCAGFGGQPDANILRDGNNNSCLQLPEGNGLRPPPFLIYTFLVQLNSYSAVLPMTTLVDRKTTFPLAHLSGAVTITVSKVGLPCEDVEVMVQTTPTRYQKCEAQPAASTATACQFACVKTDTLCSQMLIEVKNTQGQVCEITPSPKY